MNQCQQARQEYEELKALKQEYDLEYEKAQQTNDLLKLKQLRKQLEQKRDALYEKLWTFEALPLSELKQQYDNQKEILIQNNILETLSNGKLGIKAIDNKEYAFPSIQDIKKAIQTQKQELRPKTEQGLNHLLIVPFGLKLDDLIDKYKQVILNHYHQGKLLATKENPTDADELLELDETEPVWVWENYHNADISGDLVYFPKQFNQTNHQGQTKQQILEQQGGFNVLLMENEPNIPREHKGKQIHGRKQLETNKTAKEYLEILTTNPQYISETGITPEEHLIYAIQYLEQTNQVIDDFQGKGSLSYQLGAYFPASGNVPDTGWNRDYRQAFLDWYYSGDRYFSVGARGAVRIKLKI